MRAARASSPTIGGPKRQAGHPARRHERLPAPPRSRVYAWCARANRPSASRRRRLHVGSTVASAACSASQSARASSMILLGLAIRRNAVERAGEAHDDPHQPSELVPEHDRPVASS